MIIRDVSWHPYRVPLRGHFATAHGARQWREGIIIGIATAPGITGVGEIASLPEFGDASVDDILALLPKLAATLRGMTVEDALKMPDIFGICGIEMTLLDALGKERGVSVGALLAPPGVLPRADVPVNAVIGARDAEMATEAARQAAAAGYRCIKLKVGMEQGAECEIARIAQVREAIGADIALRLDANEAWDMARALAVLSHCTGYNIQYVEQPLPRDDLTGLRALRASIDIPIAVDEAIDSLESARALLADRLADVFVIKPQVVGGLRITQQIIDEAAAILCPGDRLGVQCVISSAIESGIGLAALLHLVAATPAVTLECGLATTDLLVDDLIVEAFPIINGEIAVPRGSGLGVNIDEEALNRYGYN
jgi:o-succinylbenzoate synthase